MLSFNLELMLIVSCAIALTAGLLMLAWHFQSWRRSVACDAQRMFEQLDLIRSELLLLAERAEQPVEVASPRNERPAQIETRPAPVGHAPPPRGYEVAARLARGGATCDELISSCGLSRHEAQLLLRLHSAEAARGKLPEKPTEEKRTRLSVVG